MSRTAFGALLFLVAATARANDTAEASLKEVARLYRAVDYLRALKALEAAQRQSSGVADDVRIGLYRALVLCQMGRAEEGLAAFRTALALDPAATLPEEVPPKISNAFEKERKEALAKRAAADAARAASPPAPAPEPPRPAPSPAEITESKRTATAKPTEAIDFGPVAGAWLISDVLGKDVGVEAYAGVHRDALEATVRLRAGGVVAPGVLVSASAMFGPVRLSGGARLDYYASVKALGVGPVVAGRVELGAGFGLVAAASGEYYAAPVPYQQWGVVASGGLEWR